MEFNQLLQWANVLATGFNNTSAFIAELNNRPLSDDEISDYFNSVRYLVGKVSNTAYIAILDVYECAVKGEPVNWTGNSAVNAGLQVSASAIEVGLAKCNLTDTMLSTLFLGIERDFSDIAKIISNDVELMMHPDARNFLLELTPVIKAKLKKAMKDSVDASKRVAEEQKSFDTLKQNYNVPIQERDSNDNSRLF